METIELSKTTLALIILGCLFFGTLIGATISFYRSQKWVKKYKNKNGTTTIRIGEGIGGSSQTFWDFLWSSMWSVFWIIFWGIILFKIIKWLIG